MITIPINIQVPELWASQTFTKTEWGSINLIVGSNGTGKSLLAEQLKHQLTNNRYKVRSLNAERLAGFEKQDYRHFQSARLKQGLNISEFSQLKVDGENFGLSTSAFITLKERLDIKIKIEALLSDIFDKTFRLVEEGGFLIPKIQSTKDGIEYSVKEKECHGLKELLTVLTFLYDDGNNCMIIDEPELHLHPQFQSFLLNEIRGLAGDPNVDPRKKLFFIITHSPYFIDLRDIVDFKNILVCHYNAPPTFVDTLSSQEEYILKRFLPRFNTHHKQFFFSPNPVFVEGYTDQQVITLLFDRLDYKISASGSCVIDVGGKDELSVFFNICKKLKIEGRIIADLDAFFKGKLREVAQLDSRCNLYLQSKGLGTDLASEIGELDRKLKEVADDLVTKSATDSDLIHLIAFLKPIVLVGDKRNDVITSLLIALQKFNEKILNAVSTAQQPNVNYILPKFYLLLEAFKAANIFIIPNGELEHFYTQTKIDYLNFSDNIKNNSFHIERDYLLSATKAELENNYSELLKLLRMSVPQIKVDLSKHLKFQIVEWIQSVQRAISKGDVTDLNTLKGNAKIDYQLFSQIIEVVDLEVQPDKRFSCKIQINKSLSITGKEIEFNEKTIPHEFELNL